MSEEFGKYLGEIRKAKSSILEMSAQEWQNCCDYASKTGQRVRVSSKDDITVDGMPMSYDHIVDGLMSIEAAENDRDVRMSLY